MEQTTTYQLSQWAAEDRILRENFNADNLKTEQVLAAVAEQAALVSQCGNCEIYYGTYVGTGSGATTLTFDKKPLFVTIMGDNIWLVAVQGAPTAIAKNAGTGTGKNDVTWSGNSVSIASSSEEPRFQCNISGDSYYVIALMDTSV